MCIHPHKYITCKLLVSYLCFCYLCEAKPYFNACAVKLMVAMGTTTLHFVRMCLLILQSYGDFNTGFFVAVVIGLVVCSPVRLKSSSEQMSLFIIRCLSDPET